MQKKSWISTLKLAIINKDFDQIEKLSKDIPRFETLDESQEALALIEQVNVLLKNEKEKILSQMQKLKKTKEYLN
jgi:hypothetical protein